MPNSPSISAVDPGWAWAPFVPSPDRPWSLRLAGHLYRRAGFGASWAQLQRALTLGPGATVQDLIEPPGGGVEFNARFDQFESAAARSGDARGFNAWWLRRLLESPFPVLERITLFWHDHFAIAASAVGDLSLFQRHLRLLRGKALDDLGSILTGLLEDPAMYLAAGAAHNRKAQPNQVFAGRWLRQFTVGPEGTAESDVRDTARALTGWFVYRGQLEFIAREHDAGAKRILETTGNLGRDDLARVLSEHPATARNTARRLYRWLIAESEPAPEGLLAPLVRRLAGRGRVREVIELMLRSNLFFSDHAYRQRIKSPVEFIVGLARGLQLSPPTVSLASDLEQLGQRLDEPPTAAGWPGGVHWINTATISERRRLGEALLTGARGYGKGLDPQAAARQQTSNPATDPLEFWLTVLVQGDLPESVLARIRSRTTRAAQNPAPLRETISAVIAHPEFQLA